MNQPHQNSNGYCFYRSFFILISPQFINLIFKYQYKLLKNIIFQLLAQIFFLIYIYQDKKIKEIQNQNQQNFTLDPNQSQNKIMQKQQSNQQNQSHYQQNKKTKEQREKERQNTDNWLKKQQEKKKKKKQEQQLKNNVELDQKALEKAKRKQLKRLERDQMLKQQQSKKHILDQSETNTTSKTKTNSQNQQVKIQNKQTKVQKQQNKISEQQVKILEQRAEQKKIQQKKTQQKQLKIKKQIQKQSEIKKSEPKKKQSEKQIKQEKIDEQTKQSIKIGQPVYTQLLSLQQHTNKKQVSKLSIKKAIQLQLIHKYLDQYINSNDVILILSKQDNWHPLNEANQIHSYQNFKRVYLYPNHNEFAKDPNCQNIFCTYEDVAYLMECTITKVFVQIDLFFANGACLTQKGNQNVICLANLFKIPVIGFTSTGSYNAWNFLSMEMLINKYGQAQLEKFDIIENQQLEIIVLQIGSVLPKQISSHLHNLSEIYKGYDFKSVKW